MFTPSLPDRSLRDLDAEDELAGAVLGRIKAAIGQRSSQTLSICCRGFRWWSGPERPGG